MGTDRDDEPEDVLELTPDMEADDVIEDEDVDDDADADGDDDPDGEVDVVSFADEADAADKPDDSSTIRRMRQELRDAKRQLAEANKVNVPAKVEIGEKPTLESCGYDGDLFEAELDKWKDRKATAEQAQSAEQERAREHQAAWEQDVASFETKKAALGFEDYADAQGSVETSLDLVQQAVIVKAANDPALFIYALGKSDAKLSEMAKIKDPIKMAAAVARMEGAIKVEKRRKGPAIDRPATGTGAMPGGTDKQLEKLEKEADRTGDRSKLIRYKKDRDAKKK
ncbi:MAG: hypothetical protein V4696_00695 [Pseudomonadota bacterium]